MRYTILCLLLLAAAGFTSAADPACQSFALGEDGPDLAPLEGYVDVCSRDPALCKLLTQGYPENVQTVGYFVSKDEYALYRQTKKLNFGIYFFAQIGKHMTAEEFAGFREFARGQAGAAPSRKELPALLDREGKVSLGVIDDQDDAVAIGSVMMLNTQRGTLALGATNVTLQLPEHSLMLYVYHPYEREADIDALIGMTRDWLGCVRAAN